MKSDMSIEGDDWRWALIYWALTCTAKDRVELKLQNIIPRRNSKRKQSLKNQPRVLTAQVDESIEC